MPDISRIRSIIPSYREPGDPDAIAYNMGLVREYVERVVSHLSEQLSRLFNRPVLRGDIGIYVEMLGGLVSRILGVLREIERLEPRLKRASVDVEGLVALDERLVRLIDRLLSIAGTLSYAGGVDLVVRLRMVRDLLHRIYESLVERLELLRGL